MAKKPNRESMSIWHSSRLGATVVWADNVQQGQPDHLHDDLQIVQIIRGAPTFTIDNKPFAVKPLDFVVVKPGVVHSVDLMQGGTASARILHLTLDRLAEATRDGRSLFNAVFASPELTARFRNLHQAVYTGATALELDETALQVVSTIASITGPDHRSHAIERPSDACLNSIREYIDAHANDPITLDDLVRVSCISKFHLIRAFKERFGMTPHRYQLQARVNKARRLILEGAAPAAAASATGFVDQSHMNRQFTRFIMESPGQVARSKSI